MKKQGKKKLRFAHQRKIKKLISYVWPLALILIVIMGACLGLQTQKHQARFKTETQQLGQIQAQALNQLVVQYLKDLKKGLEWLGAHPSLTYPLKRGDLSSANAALKQLDLQFLGAGHHLHIYGEKAFALQESSELGFAALEMIQQGLNGKDTLVEVHTTHANGPHLNLLIPLSDAQNPLSGAYVLFLSQPLSALKAQLEEVIGTSAYLELQQTSAKGAHVFLKIGNPQGTFIPLSSLSVQGTRWASRIHVSTGALVHGSMEDFFWTWAIGVLGIIVTILGGLYLFYRHVQQDLVLFEQCLTRNCLIQGRAMPLFKIDLFCFAYQRLLQEIVPCSQEESSKASTALNPVMFTPNTLKEKKEKKDMSVEILEPPVHICDSIFKANDIRGVVGQNLNESVMGVLGQALGTQAQRAGISKVIIGRDGRNSGASLLKALSQGLQQTGCHVINIGCVTSPMLYFSTYHFKTGTGIMLTGSHNPPQYNGLKMMIADETLRGEKIKALSECIQKQQFHQGQGSERLESIEQAYIEAIQRNIQLKRPLKVVVDAGNGAASVIAPALFKALNCEVIPLYCEVDGNFPNHHPDPSNPTNLKDLIEKTQATQADVGFAFDGDGDRLGVVTSKGEIIWPDRQLMLFAKDLLAQHPGAKIVYDVKCTAHLKPLIEGWQGEALMTKTGHAFIKAQMKKTQALLGGEMSGHFFFKDRWFGFDDATYAGARLLEILANDANESSLSHCFAQFPDSVNTPEIQIPIAEEKKFKFMDALIQQGDFKEHTMVTIDGLRLETQTGWGLVRASNTTSCLVLRFEAQSQDDLLNIQHYFKQMILSIDPSLKCPF